MIRELVIICQFISMFGVETTNLAKPKPKNETIFKPVKLKKDYHPYLVMVVEDVDNVKTENFVACGTVINIKWVLTKASAVSTDKKWVVVGENRLNFSQDLKDVKKRKVEKLALHPSYNPGKKLNRGNAALLRVENPFPKFEAFLNYDLVPGHSQSRMKNVYWILDNNHFVKHEMSWLLDKTCQRISSPNFCLTSTTKGGWKENFGAEFPCQKNSVSEGGPFLMENEVQGVYFGVENTGKSGRNGCDREPNSGKWKNKLNHVAIQILLSAKWIKETVNSDLKLPQKPVIFECPGKDKLYISPKRRRNTKRPKTGICKINKDENRSGDRMLVLILISLLFVRK